MGTEKSAKCFYGKLSLFHPTASQPPREPRVNFKFSRLHTDQLTHASATHICQVLTKRTRAHILLFQIFPAVKMHLMAGKFEFQARCRPKNGPFLDPQILCFPPNKARN